MLTHKRRISYCVFSLFYAISALGDAPLIRSYVVNKKVSDFSLPRDMSKPETAYATIMRDFMATGASPAEWSDVSTYEEKDAKRRLVSPERAQAFLNAHIQEVIIYKNRVAVVIAQMQEGGVMGYDQRYLCLTKGRWLNSKQYKLASSMEEARHLFLQECDRLYRSHMEKIGEPVEPCCRAGGLYKTVP
jgi:hypothetical protein